MNTLNLTSRLKSNISTNGIKTGALSSILNAHVFKARWEKIAADFSQHAHTTGWTLEEDVLRTCQEARNEDRQKATVRSYKKLNLPVNLL